MSRIDYIKRARKQGKTYQQIAKTLRISRQRVWQLDKKSPGFFEKLFRKP